MSREDPPTLASDHLDDFPLPANLPEPIDDGDARHLPGMEMPRLFLNSTHGGKVNLAELSSPRTVIFIYPMTGKPGVALPLGWDEVPGARGCTPQACSFRNLHKEFAELETEVFGLSTQTTAYQKEMAERLQLPYAVLSDEDFHLGQYLNLPSFQINGTRFYKRLTLIVRGQLIEHVIYPVFPSDRSAADTLAWLKAHR